MQRLWIFFGVVLVLSFAVLGWIGTRIYQAAPPIADKVVTTDGKVVIDVGEIDAGQNVWQSLGGMEVGSVWGHGAYVAPDWTADWLHRESVFILDRWAKNDFNASYDELSGEHQAQLSAGWRNSCGRIPTTRRPERLRLIPFEPRLFKPMSRTIRTCFQMARNIMRSLPER